MRTMDFSDDDRFWLQRALALAADNVRRGGGPFGAVLTLNGRCVAEGCNRVLARHDPTAHAEIEVLRAAGRALKQFHLCGATLYASSEPCPMCLAAAYWARVDRIVYANPREAAAAVGFCDDELYAELALPAAARRLPALYLALPDADAPLVAWRDKTDKTPY